MRAGRWPALWRAAAAVVAACVLEARAQDRAPLVVSPPGERIELRVGQRRVFSAVMPEAGTVFTWSLDGASKGKGSQFELRPTAGFVGTHEVSVTAVAPSMAARHTWVVSVAAVGAPTIVRAVPEAATLRAPAGEPIAFELKADPAALTDAVTVRWSLDGVSVGEGPRLTVRAPASGSQRLRAVAASEYGGATVREWQIVASAGEKGAAPPPPAETDVPLDPELAEIVRRAVPGKPPPVVAATKREPPPRIVAAVKKEVPAPQKAAEPVPTKKAPVPTKKAPVPAKKAPVPAKKAPVPPAPSSKPAAAKPPPEKRAAERLAAKAAPPTVPPPPPTPPPPPPPPAPSGVTEDDVRALMFRYEQAWRTRNAAELRRIGHVETDAQEQALVKYFETTNDLEVAVHVLELHADGGRGVVRFTRRDHFRDPTGREVSKESPPIEKTIVRTPEGVRFAPRS